LQPIIALNASLFYFWQLNLNNMKKAINEFAIPINGAVCGDVTRVAGKGVGCGGAYFSILGDFVTGHQIEDVSNESITQPWRIMDRVH
jgi:hypothetical protein